MAETPSPPTEPQSAPAPDPAHQQQYWCYHCDKRVNVETLADLPDVVCLECKNGFVEAIAHSAAAAAAATPDLLVDDPFSSQFLQVLRLIAQAARDDDAPPPPPSDQADPSDDDYLRIELDGWDDHNNENDDVNDDDDEDDDDQGVVVRNETDDDDEENDRRDESGEDARRRRRDVLRLMDLAARAASRRNRIRDWADILMGLEDHSIEIRRHAPEMDDDYVGNPEDYLDAAGYEALLQNLAESDGNARRGAPPASKSALLGLKDLEIASESACVVCAICKDSVNVGEKAKEMPCGHGYHEECIVPWLGSRNSCPVCRFELETDDAEYEEERRKRGTGKAAAAAIGPSTSSDG